MCECQREKSTWRAKQKETPLRCDSDVSRLSGPTTQWFVLAPIQEEDMRSFEHWSFSHIQVYIQRFRFLISDEM